MMLYVRPQCKRRFMQAASAPASHVPHLAHGGVVDDDDDDDDDDML
jgi:hypothetical protein